MHYADLTPFEYNSAYSGLNVGWLDSAHEFPTGVVPHGFLAALFGVIASGDHTRCAAAGGHVCNLCDSRQAIYELDGDEIMVGNTEISVPYDGTDYIAPTLIYHYVQSHDYLPPEPFIRGVIEAAR